MGQTSRIRLLPDGRVEKVLIRRDAESRRLFENESFWLEKLSRTGLVPRVSEVSHEELRIVMDHAGEPISRANAPRDWQEQVLNFLQAMKYHGCSHNDLTEDEILVSPEGRLCFIDFGAASELGSQMSGFNEKQQSYRKQRILNDSHIINLLRVVLTNDFDFAEPHCLVLWDSNHREEIYRAINESFAIAQEVTYAPESLRTRFRGRKMALTDFYGGRVSTHGKKGKTRFSVFFVFDETPSYGLRSNAYNGAVTRVNTNVFDLKMELRKGREGFLHASDTMQEAFDNFRALDLYPRKSAFRYFNLWRNRFQSEADLWTFVRRAPGLTATILRDASTSNEGQHEPQGDIDLLVNDYLRFKTVTGAVSYKHRVQKFRKSFGLPPEYGGTKVACEALIGGRRIFFDVRHPGDGYMDPSWQDSILHRAASSSSQKIAPDDAFYSTAYHVLFHKPRIAQKYIPYLNRELDRRGYAAGGNLRTNLTKALGDFFNLKGYSLCRPSEVSIPFQALRTLGVTPAQEMARALNEARRGDYFLAASRVRTLSQCRDFQAVLRWLLVMLVLPLRLVGMVKEVSLFSWIWAQDMAEKLRLRSSVGR